MFDHQNLVCRLFAAYMLQAAMGYAEETALYVANRFYDHVEKFKDEEDAYTRAQWKVPVFASWFQNMERHYERAVINRTGETGNLLYQAEMKAADTPVDYPLYVRKDENTGLWKMYRKLARGAYELVPQYANVVGFSSKAKAERRARELENIKAD